MARPKKIKEDKDLHDFPVHVPEYQTRPLSCSSWKKEAVVLKTMYHKFGLPGRIGDTVFVNPDMYDQLIKEKFIR